MNELFCELRYDSGRVELVSQVFAGHWRDCYTDMLSVFCRANDRELVPLRIELAPGVIESRWDSAVGDMV